MRATVQLVILPQLLTCCARTSGRYTADVEAERGSDADSSVDWEDIVTPLYTTTMADTTVATAAATTAFTTTRPATAPSSPPCARSTLSPPSSSTTPCSSLLS